MTFPHDPSGYLNKLEERLQSSSGAPTEVVEKELDKLLNLYHVGRRAERVLMRFAPHYIESAHKPGLSKELLANDSWLTENSQTLESTYPGKYVVIRGPEDVLHTSNEQEARGWFRESANYIFWKVPTVEEQEKADATKGTYEDIVENTLE